jgi:2-oxoglutarate dehydrogenase E1 component
MIEVPIFHVNGEDPESVVYVAELALDFRQEFGKDVVIDMVCYRRHGHNEGDEPAFTQPLMYGKIRDRMSVRELYTESLVMSGELSCEENETIHETFIERMQEVYDEVHSGNVPDKMPEPGFAGNWQGLSPHYSFEPVATGVPYETLKALSDAMAKVPPGFHVNPKIERIYGTRAKVMESKGMVDWGFAEALAFGSLLIENTPVRLSGQDSRRGTFSHRHAMLVDGLTGDRYIPLNNLGRPQAELCVYDSLLSEAAVLGFDYGYSLDEPHMLILWEAQFGDFANGAQVIIDQFIVPSTSKWQRDSGLVMLLPHGYEGQGPEHSSARIERFLQMCAEDNIQVVYPSTPAQYFHLLRRQMKRDFRKPLIVFTPKSMLRHKAAVSPVDELTTGHFQEILDDIQADPSRVRRVLLCSGKVYYDLAERRAQEEKGDVAILRVEQFYPFPVDPLRRALARYRKAQEWLWVQEESLNMGGWTFMEQRLRAMNVAVKYVGRDASASPATGSRQVHLREQKELVEAAIAGPAPHLVRSVMGEGSWRELMKVRKETREHATEKVEARKA